MERQKRGRRRAGSSRKSQPAVAQTPPTPQARAADTDTQHGCFFWSPGKRNSGGSGLCGRWSAVEGDAAERGGQLVGEEKIRNVDMVEVEGKGGLEVWVSVGREEECPPVGLDRPLSSRRKHRFGGGGERIGGSSVIGGEGGGLVSSTGQRISVRAGHSAQERESRALPLRHPSPPPPPPPPPVRGSAGGLLLLWLLLVCPCGGCFSCMPSGGSWSVVHAVAAPIVCPLTSWPLKRSLAIVALSVSQKSTNPTSLL